MRKIPDTKEAEIKSDRRCWRDTMKFAAKQLLEQPYEYSDFIRALQLKIDDVVPICRKSNPKGNFDG